MSEQNNSSGCCCGCILLYILASIGSAIAEYTRSPMVGIIFFVVVVVILLIAGSSANKSGSGQSRREESSDNYNNDESNAEFAQRNSSRSQQDILRLIFFPLGYIAQRSSSSLNMQYVYLDNVIEEIGLDAELARNAMDYAQAGRVASKQEIRNLLERSREFFKDDQIVDLFRNQILLLFYDELVTRKEMNLFFELGGWYRLPRTLVNEIFQDIILAQGLRYDQQRDCYGRFHEQNFSSNNRNNSSGSGYNREEQRKQESNQRSSYSSSRSSSNSLRDAYNFLNVSEGASDAEVKKAYRRMMSKYHPDRAIAQGLGDAGVRKYTEISQSIQQAWDTIKTHRGI